MAADNVLHWADYVVLILVLGLSLFVGVYFSLRGGCQKTTDDFLIGSQGLTLIPVALSIFIGTTSGVLVLGVVAEVYQYSTQYLMRVVGSVTSYIVGTLLVVPVLYPLKIVSVYQWYELRFHSMFLRRLLSLLYILQQVFDTSMAAYAPSTALEAVTGLPTWASVTSMMLVCTVYTSIGGLKAVIWTDALQGLVYIGGLLLILIVGSTKVGGFDDVWKINKEGGRIVFFNMDLSPTARATFWNACVVHVINSMGTYVIGQNVFQRLLCLPTLRQAQRAVFLSCPLNVLVYVLLGLVGMVVYAYYAATGCDPIRANFISNPNQLLPYFILNVIRYPGFTGLVMAILFSGSLSNISTSMSTVSAVLWTDFLEPIFRKAKPEHQTLGTKLIVVVYGFTCLGISFLIANLPGHIQQISDAILGAFGGTTWGIKILGLYCPCGNEKGAIAGALASTAMGIWINVGQFVYQPYTAPLPTIVDNCTLPGNTTVSPPQEDNIEGIFPLYSLSFNWFGVLVTLVALVVGIVVSKATGGMAKGKLDRRMIVPVADVFFCCCPTPLRRWLSCGLWEPDREEEEKEEEEKEDEEEEEKVTAHYDNKAVELAYIEGDFRKLNHNDITETDNKMVIKM